MQPNNPPWTLRDSITAASLFIATAAVVLWQNAHIAVLWDLSYLLDSSWRIALGQLPYRDFPFAHAPLTFLIQAAIIRVTGRVFFHHVLYAAIIGGLATLLTWRIALRTLTQTNIDRAWTLALLLSIPLTLLGIYCIYPHPIYDSDCIFSILVAVFFLQRLPAASTEFTRRVRIRQIVQALITGATLVIPIFVKQNIGLPFFLVAIVGIALLFAIRLTRRNPSSALPATLTLLVVLASALATLTAALILIQATVGLHNYIYWTVTFAAQRRLPGVASMLGVYREPSLLWTLPAIALGLLLLLTALKQFKGSRIAALALLASPFLWTVVTFFLNNDADDRADALLALWPLLLILASVLALYKICAAPTLNTLLPLLLLAAICGTMMSQQLWGSTYAIWPLLILLLAAMIAFLASTTDGVASSFAPLLPMLAAIISGTLLLCGGLYALSNERLSYIHFDEGELAHATLPALKGMTARGPYLPEFEGLIRFAESNIPANDGLLLLDGEDPFYYATGRTPQFPVLLFDPATDPYSPSQIVDLARSKNIRWLIVKRNLQLKEDPMPAREETIKLLQQEFTLYKKLNQTDIYRLNLPFSP